MLNNCTEKLCNLAFIGQTGAGKTSLVEQILFKAKVTERCGSVAEGNTVCDFDTQEKSYQHSFSSALVHFDYQQRHFNCIDTPGLSDFIGRAMSSFPAVESVALVVDAVNGVDASSRYLFEQAKERKLCRFIIINKIDDPNADLPGLLAELKQQFGAECLPLNLPADNRRRAVDCFFNPEGESDLGPVAEWHEQIIDQVVEVDEDLMAVYLEQGQNLSPEQLHAPFEKALREAHLIPVCFVSAQTGAGVLDLLEVLAALAPNPLEGNPRPFLKGVEEEAQAFAATPDPAQHALAHVFKIMADPFVGKLAVFRLHQGRISKDAQLYIGDSKKPFKVNHLFKFQGKEHVEINEAFPGDLCAVSKVDLIHFDAVLHDSHEEDYIHLKPLNFPQPLYGLAVAPAAQGDEQKMSMVLEKLVDEDPCLKVEHRSHLNETVLLGLGEMHLRIVLERISESFGLQLKTSAPKIAYQETISTSAEGHYRHKKQSGGAGQFAEVYLRVTPKERGTGNSFKNAITGGAIPANFIPAVEKGVLSAQQQGAIAGYPLQDVEVTVYDGKFHSVDSKEVAFVIAGKKAFIEAVKNAKPQVLEPVVNLEVVCPETDMGAVSGDISTKRGHLQGSDIEGNQRMSLSAQVPLSELGEYAAQLKALTSGQGTYRILPSHYQPVPSNVQASLVAAYQPREDEA